LSFCADAVVQRFVKCLLLHKLFPCAVALLAGGNSNYIVIMLPLVPTQFQPTGQFLSTQVTYVLFDPCVAQNMLGQLNRRLELAGTEDAVDPDNIWFLFGISLGTHT
jgi:hypothetical protein